MNHGRLKVLGALGRARKSESVILEIEVFRRLSPGKLCKFCIETSHLFLPVEKVNPAPFYQFTIFTVLFIAQDNCARRRLGPAVEMDKF